MPDKTIADLIAELRRHDAAATPNWRAEQIGYIAGDTKEHRPNARAADLT